LSFTHSSFGHPPKHHQETRAAPKITENDVSRLFPSRAPKGNLGGGGNREKRTDQRAGFGYVQKEGKKEQKSNQKPTIGGRKIKVPSTGART